MIVVAILVVGWLIGTVIAFVCAVSGAWDEKP